MPLPEDIGPGLLLKSPPGADRLLMVFGGLAGGAVHARFEATQITAGWPVHVLVVRDLHNSFYHRGIDASRDSIMSVARYLLELMEQVRPARIVTFGASAGGYGALLFGHLIGATEVHAFSPLTRLSPLGRQRMADHRWAIVHDELTASGALDERYADLPELLDNEGAGSVLHVHYASDDPHDVSHASAISAHVRLHEYPHGGHSFVRQLRDDGRLTQLLLGALDCPEVTSTAPSSAPERTESVSPADTEVLVLDELGDGAGSATLTSLAVSSLRSAAVTLTTPTPVTSQASWPSTFVVHDQHDAYFGIYRVLAEACLDTRKRAGRSCSVAGSSFPPARWRRSRRNPALPAWSSDAPAAGHACGHPLPRRWRRS